MVGSIVGKGDGAMLGAIVGVMEGGQMEVMSQNLCAQ